MSQQPQPLPDEPTPAPRSGGPRTPEGKDTLPPQRPEARPPAKVLTPDEMIDDVMNRTADFAKEFQPRTTYQEWLVGEIALATVRIDRCAALSIVDLQRRINHAGPCWDLDRRRDVAALGAGLKTRSGPRPARPWKRPPRRRLADQALGRPGQVLERLGDWNDAQQRLALDLLGTPPELRSGRRRPPRTGRPPAASSRGSSTGSGPAGFVPERSGRRPAHPGRLRHADDRRPDHANLQRYERSRRRALHWAHAELQRLQAEPAEPPVPAQEPQPEPVPTRDVDDSFRDLLRRPDDGPERPRCRAAPHAEAPAPGPTSTWTSRSSRPDRATAPRRRLARRGPQPGLIAIE